MHLEEAIAARRSIRNYQDTLVSEDVIRKVIEAGTLAPSGKNRQPWRFYVIQGEKRTELFETMKAGLERLRAQGVGLGSSPWSAKIMLQAPVTLLVFNGLEETVDRKYDLTDMFTNWVDVQSIGAAIQNMLLQAQALGLGSLWICDIYFAYPELCAWLGETHQMIAAVALGYPAEAPDARPRKPVDAVTTWLA